MVQNITKSKFLDINYDNSQQMLKSIQKYINRFDCPEMTLDLTKLNILDAARVMVLSSTYHYKKYPEGKITCRVQSDSIRNFVLGFSTTNLEVMS